ncbi:glycine cleavage system protein T [bacterium]|nr:glycine cleavage system protein T [bacterium]
MSLNGRMVEFAGFELPVQYKSIIAEAQAVRNGAGMFDVSHMARLTFRGENVLEFLEHITVNDVAALADDQGQYSMLPNANGGVVDDIIVYRITSDTYRMVVNAANHQKDLAHIKSLLPDGISLTDQTSETAMIAVQGPRAAEIVYTLTQQSEDLKALAFFGTATVEIAGVTTFAARSGYTGEDGFELICSASDASALWNALHRAGVEPCGLGSRDTLRVEAGLPLYGHELLDDLSPIAAGLGWVISKTKPFLGSELINAARENGTAQKLQGIRMDGKRFPTPGMKVTVDGTEVGEVTSGVYSPLLEAGIAFAFINSDIKLGTPCTVDIRGKNEPATIVSKRFFKRS